MEIDKKNNKVIDFQMDEELNVIKTALYNSCCCEKYLALCAV